MLETVRQFWTLQGELTKRGTPSGSPMLMTVCSCFDRDEPNNCQITLGHFCVCSQLSLQAAVTGASRTISCLESAKNERTTVNILNKLGLRSCPYFGLEEAGVEDCCGC
jgi:hypothetical protein